MPVKWMTKEKSLRLLKKAKYGRLATCGDERQPYITPVNFILIDEKIYFHCGFKGQKIDNLKANPKVCFEVSRLGKLYVASHAKNFSNRFWSVLIFGKAKQVKNENLKLDVLNKIMEKYASGYDYVPLTIEDTKIVNIIEITIEKITGKVSVNPPSQSA
jgi:uncharacterized protein